MTIDGRLTVKQLRFVKALTLTLNIASAASVAGIGERTAYRYLKSPLVIEALDQWQSEVMAQTARQVVSGASAAVQTLIKVTEDAALPVSVRVQAAKAILDSSLKLSESVTLARRLEGMEALLKGGDENGDTQGKA